MKFKEKQLAIRLRKKGYSINEIKDKLKVAKSSVSLWVREIELTREQKKRLSEKGVKRETIEKRRRTRLVNEDARRQIIIDKAKKDIVRLSKKDLKTISVALYWAEGAKRKRNVVQFCNSDPKMIKIMMRFFREICEVPEEKFRGHIHIHSHLSAKKAEEYWSGISGISLSQFYKSYCKPSKASKHKKDTLPLGTFDIYVCDTELFLKIKGWTEKIYELTMNMPR